MAKRRDFKKSNEDALMRKRGIVRLGEDTGPGDAVLRFGIDQPFLPEDGRKMGDLYREVTGKRVSGGQLVWLLEEVDGSDECARDMRLCSEKELRECMRICRLAINRMSGRERTSGVAITLGVQYRPVSEDQNDFVKELPSKLTKTLLEIDAISNDAKRLIQYDESARKECERLCLSIIRTLNDQISNRKRAIPHRY